MLFKYTLTIGISDRKNYFIILYLRSSLKLISACSLAKTCHIMETVNIFLMTSCFIHTLYIFHIYIYTVFYIVHSTLDFVKLQPSPVLQLSQGLLRSEFRFNICFWFKQPWLILYHFYTRWDAVYNLATRVLYILLLVGIPIV